MTTDTNCDQFLKKWEMAAVELDAEHRASKRFKPFAADCGICGLADAYAVQREYVKLLQKYSSASSIGGYKIGLTSKQMQSMCAIDSPVSGVILSERISRYTRRRARRAGLRDVGSSRSRQSLSADGHGSLTLVLAGSGAVEFRVTDAPETIEPAVPSAVEARSRSGPRHSRR